MSDNEDLLGDDFVDQGFADDTYNLGNEEEDILLADDTFELNHYEAPKIPIVHEKLAEPIQIISEVKIVNPQETKEIRHEVVVDKPAVTKPAIEKPAVEKPAVEKPAVAKPAVEKPTVEKPTVAKSTVEKPTVEKQVPAVIEKLEVIKEVTLPIQPESLPKKKEKVAIVQPEPAPVEHEETPVPSQLNNRSVEDEVPEENKDAVDSTNKHKKDRAQEESRYRAGHRERFPTERENEKPTRAAPHIPDTLDSVVTPDSYKNFHGGRGPQNFRGDKRYNMRDSGRARLPGERYFPDRFVDNGANPVNFRPYPDFRLHPNAPEFRPLPNDQSSGGNFVQDPTRDFGPQFRGDPRNFHSDFSGPPVDFQRVMSGNSVQESSSRPNDAGFIGRMEDNTAPGNFLPRRDMRNSGRPFVNAPQFPSDMSRRPPVGLVPPLFETFHGPNFRHVMPSAPPAFEGSQSQTSKKVLINPHFKGPLPSHPPQRLVYPTSRPPPGLEMRQRPPPLGDRNVHMSVPPPFLPVGVAHNESYHHRNVQLFGPDSRRGEGYGGPSPFNPMNGGGSGPSDGPVSDEALERLTEQFIDEQRRCLQKAKVAQNDDFFEKTQRFIENATKDVRSVEPIMAIDPDAAEKERLRRKQEDFINSNRHNLSLNLRRRRLSPSNHQATSATGAPYKTKARKPLSPAASRKRSRSPLLQSQSSISPSDPEEREYRVRLREQAEMRERVLLAKERRRRRDANIDINNTALDKTAITPPDTAASATHDESKRPNTPPKAFVKTVKAVENPPMLVESKKETSPAIRVETVSSTSVQAEAVTSSKPSEDNIEEKLLEENEMEHFLEEMLEDDALHLSADEDLLLSDDESGCISRIAKHKTNRAASVSKMEASSEQVARSDANAAETKRPTVKRSNAVKGPSQMVSSGKPVSGLKRPAADNAANKQDLRSKLGKSNDATQAQEKKTDRQTQPRRQIVYSDDNSNSKQSTAPLKQPEQKEKEPQILKSPNKWRSTFTEEKAERIAPIMARAISAAIRTATSEASGRKVMPSARQSQGQSSKASAANGSPPKGVSGIFGGRRVVLGTGTGSGVGNSGRVVLPRQKRQPTVIVEKEDSDEPEPYDEDEEAAEAARENGNRAAVSGLPPGMTEARLLSLCGSQVENVKMGSATGTAEATFLSLDACQRFITRFNGRFVAACCLRVRLAD